MLRGWHGPPQVGVISVVLLLLVRLLVLLALACLNSNKHPAHTRHNISLLVFSAAHSVERPD
jgi:hypothetical protein